MPAESGGYPDTEEADMTLAVVALVLVLLVALDVG